MKITPEVLNEHIDKIIDITKSIEANKVTILVGRNGVGKSLIRKQLSLRFNKVRSVSMQARTESRPEFDALSNCLHDDPTNPTSLESFHLIDSVFKRDLSNKFLVLDEVEIGMSLESIAGIADYIKDKIPSWLEQSDGVLIITHSEYLAKRLYDSLDCNFIELGYNTVNYDFDAWYNREVIPTDFEFLKKWSIELYRAVLRRAKKKHENS